MGNQESFDHEENVVVLREKIKEMAIAEARRKETESFYVNVMVCK